MDNELEILKSRVKGLEQMDDAKTGHIDRTVKVVEQAKEYVSSILIAVKDEAKKNTSQYEEMTKTKDDMLEISNTLKELLANAQTMEKEFNNKTDVDIRKIKDFAAAVAGDKYITEDNLTAKLQEILPKLLKHLDSKKNGLMMQIIINVCASVLVSSIVVYIVGH